ncbi:MAG: sigma-70 family RNA polymerase sigma factor [Arachidicoccus sp.]|nr:sigma-70 family RNA polymerase sigma factor [Arachidicoccus sp.]
MYLKYIKKMVQRAYQKTGSIEIAEEIAQNTFLKFYEKGIHIEGEPLGYLHVILKNEIVNYFRSHIELLSLQSLHDHLAYADDNVGNYIRHKELLKQYEIGIEKLPEQCRKVFLLRKDSNLSNKEVSALLGISINTVEQHMRKALKILRQQMSCEALWLLILLSQLR